jgi:hypothetical protein
MTFCVSEAMCTDALRPSMMNHEARKLESVFFYGKTLPIWEIFIFISKPSGPWGFLSSDFEKENQRNHQIFQILLLQYNNIEGCLYLLTFTIHL